MHNFALFPKIIVAALKTAIRRSYGLFLLHTFTCQNLFFNQNQHINESEENLNLKRKHSKALTRRITPIIVTNLRTQKIETQTLSSEHNGQFSKHRTQDGFENVKIKVSQNQLVTSVSDAEIYGESKNHSCSP